MKQNSVKSIASEPTFLSPCGASLVLDGFVGLVRLVIVVTVRELHVVLLFFVVLDKGLATEHIHAPFQQHACIDIQQTNSRN